MRQLARCLTSLEADLRVYLCEDKMDRGLL